MEPLYQYEQLPDLPRYAEEEEETTELEVVVKDYLAEWRHYVNV